MTEEEWLKCVNPERMYELFLSLAHWRKVYLSGCACLRRIWALIPEGHCREAVAIAERIADRIETSQEFHEVHDWVHHALDEVYREADSGPNPVHPMTLPEFYSIRAVYGIIRWMGHERVGID